MRIDSIKIDISNLVKKLRKGNIKAFDQIYFEYVPSLLAYANSIIKDQEIAEEVVQEVFIKLWERRKILDPNKSLKTYLFQCTKHQLLNYIRDQKRVVRFDMVQNKGYKEQSSNPYDDEKVEKLEVLLEKLISHLPEIQREVFTYNKIHGMKAQEIAEKLNLSKRTIEHHIYLATKFLKSQVKDKAVSLFIPLILFLI